MAAAYVQRSPPRAVPARTSTAMAHTTVPLLPTTPNNTNIIVMKVAAVAPKPPNASIHSLQLGTKCDDTSRRAFLVGGLIAAGAGTTMLGPGGIASAASKRRPPPPEEEKNDPNVSGVQAKVLASRKRKEAMKEAVAKMREKGKPLAVDK